MARKSLVALAYGFVGLLALGSAAQADNPTWGKVTQPGTQGQSNTSGTTKGSPNTPQSRWWVGNFDQDPKVGGGAGNGQKSDRKKKKGCQTCGVSSPH